jgi:hypothetical protein
MGRFGTSTYTIPKLYIGNASTDCSANTNARTASMGCHYPFSDRAASWRIVKVRTCCRSCWTARLSSAATSSMPSSREFSTLHHAILSGTAGSADNRPLGGVQHMRSLDSLLDERHEDATFHDSELLSCAVDLARATATFAFNIQCRATTPDQQFSLQRGTVAFSGLCFCFLEPVVSLDPGAGSTLWITADGPLPDERLQISEIVPRDLPADAFVHYLYSSSTNSFIVIGARSATFSWMHNEAKVR